MSDIAHTQLNEVTSEIEIKISSDELDQRIKNETSKFATEAHIKGFRKGKTPKSVIAQRYGKELRAFALRDIIERRCQEALFEADLNLQWYSTPVIEETEGENAATVTIQTEVYPPVEVANFSELNLKKPLLNLSDEQVEELIFDARANLVDWFDVEGDEVPAGESDKLIVAFELGDQAEESEGQNQDEALLQIMLRTDSDDESINELSRSLIGKKVGDVIEGTRGDMYVLKGPFDPPETDEQKKEKLTATIRKISVGSLPSLNESLLTNRGFREQLGLQNLENLSIDALHSDVKRELSKSVEKNTESLMSRQAQIQLVQAMLPILPRETLRASIVNSVSSTYVDPAAAFDLSVPDSALVSFLRNETYEWFKENTIKPSELEDGDDQYWDFQCRYQANQMDEAIDRSLLQLSFDICMQAIVEKKNLEPDESWVSEQLGDAAKVYAMQGNQEALDSIYSEEFLSRLKTASLNKQVIDTILEEAQVEEYEIPFKELQTHFNELGEHQLRSKLTITQPIQELASSTGTEELADLSDTAEQTGDEGDTEVSATESDTNQQESQEATTEVIGGEEETSAESEESQFEPSDVTESTQEAQEDAKPRKRFFGKLFQKKS